MDSAFDKGIGAIVKPFLELFDIVIEISKRRALTGVWAAGPTRLAGQFEPYIGQEIPTLPADILLSQFIGQVTSGFADRKKNYKEYTNVNGGHKITCGVKAIMAHPDENFLLLGIDELAGRAGTELIEDKWKLALDAAGDGVWDVHFDTNRIFFSEKWHEIFGYEADEIITLQNWTDKLHPDDYIKAANHYTKHLSGEYPTISLELRYMCKNGSYIWILSTGVITSKTPEGKPLRMIGTHKDITARRAMEDEKKANISLLLRLINNLPSGILVTDEHKKLVLANKAFCNMYHLGKHPRDLFGMDTEKSLQDDKLFYRDPEKLVTRIAEILENKKGVVNDELEMVDGRIISRDYIPLAFKENYRGEIWRFTDVTEQKNIEKRFEGQRQFFEHILNSMPANVATLSSDMRILYANPIFVKNGEMREWAIGKTFEEYCTKLNTPRAIIEERISYFNKAVAEKQTVEWDERLEGRKGKVSYQLRCFSPIFTPNGALDIMIAYGVDITARIQAEEALKASMNAFANSFNFSGIGKALVSPDGKWIEVNDVFCELSGYSREELLNIHYNDITYHEDIDIDAKQIAQLLNREIQTYTLEKRYISKSRQIIVASLTVFLLWNPDNTPKYFICDILDISAKKLLTDELYRQNAELEATTANLVNKINQLEELSYMIAHNLRGPAGNIKMFSERLIMDDNDPAAEDEVFTKDEAGAIVYESSIKLSNSLDTLMELTQIKLNKNIAYDDCDFKSIINDIINQLQGVIYEKHAQVNTNLEVATISYPRVYLESILYNLISNALKYSNPAKAPEITIATQQLDGKVRLSVKDNGLGIDLEVNGDKVFKLNKTFHKGFDSKGVGLFLTRSQIESLGGSITLMSKPLEGSEFITLL
jgi:PAS domain S-box-containing protein